MKIITVGFLALSTVATPRMAERNDNPRISPVSERIILAKVQSPVSQWENYEARMSAATRELDTVLNDLQQMSPETSMRIEPILEELVGRQDELAEIVVLGSEGLKDGLIGADAEITDLQKVVEPEISAFEDAVYRLRDALDHQLHRRTSI